MQLESIAQGGNKFVKQLMDYALETIENNPTINTLQLYASITRRFNVTGLNE